MAEKAKVLDVLFNREYTANGRTTYYFNIQAEVNGEQKEGQFSTNKREQTKFEIGKVYDVTIETKQNSRGQYLFFDKVKTDGAAGGGSGYSGSGKSSGGSGWVRSRSDVMSIISQSSYEAAALVALKIGKEVIDSTSKIGAISKQFMNYITDQSGLNSEACRKGDKDAMKKANEKSIVLQKALKIAVVCLDFPHIGKGMPEVNLNSTLGVINLTERISNDIEKLAKEA